MELFDHGTRASINSYACRELADGADVLEEFHSEAELSEAGRRPARTEPAKLKRPSLIFARRSNDVAIRQDGAFH